MVVSERDERVTISTALRELDGSVSEAAHDNPAAVGLRNTPRVCYGLYCLTLLLRSLKCLCVLLHGILRIRNRCLTTKTYQNTKSFFSECPQETSMCAETGELV